MIKIGIIGGAGYTAGELLRLLVHHPKAKIVIVNSKSNAGQKLSSVHSDLEGDTDLVFTDVLELDKIDVLFLCTGHGDAKKFIDETSLPQKLKLIDLSQDFRWGANTEATEQGWIYGLTELNHDKIRHAQFVANPGCFATAIQSAILPLAKNNLLDDDVHVTAITGSTGAGQKPTDTTHFSWRSNNLSIYEAFKHRHLKEITASVQSLMPNFQKNIRFVPVRGNFTRGILASVYTTSTLTEHELQTIFKEFYADAPFVNIISTAPHLKQVVGSNKIFLHITKHDDQVHIISIIDNLLKGASGQAVENMNLMFGLPHTMGLKLKALAF